MRKSLCCFTLFLLVVQQVTAQDPGSLLSNYNSKVPQEKLYVQFDNAAYTPGQTIWYKAYLQHGNKPSYLSTGLYLDWYTDNGALLARTDLPAQARLMLVQAVATRLSEARIVKGAVAPARLERLHALGYADPGRATNYWKRYPFDRYSDAAIAAEILTLLYDVYDYVGAAPLDIKTE